MLARAAENMFWMGRYLERADFAARMLEVGVSQLLYDADERAADGVAAMAKTLGLRRGEPQNVREFFAGAMLDREAPNTIAACIAQARDNAQQVRESISGDMWEAVNRMHLGLHAYAGGDAWEAAALALCRNVRDGVVSFRGLVEATFEHGEGWHFLRLGLFLERAQATARWLANLWSDEQGQSGAAWSVLLRARSAIEAYARTTDATVRPEGVIHFLLFFQDFPHTVRHAVTQMDWAVRGIAQYTGRSGGGRSSLQRALALVSARLDFAEVDGLDRAATALLLSDLLEQLQRFNNRIRSEAFVYSISSARVYA